MCWDNLYTLLRLGWRLSTHYTAAAAISDLITSDLRPLYGSWMGSTPPSLQEGTPLELLFSRIVACTTPANCSLSISIHRDKLAFWAKKGWPRRVRKAYYIFIPLKHRGLAQKPMGKSVKLTRSAQSPFYLTKKTSSRCKARKWHYLTRKCPLFIALLLTIYELWIIP